MGGVGGGVSGPRLDESEGGAARGCSGDEAGEAVAVAVVVGAMGGGRVRLLVGGWWDVG